MSTKRILALILSLVMCFTVIAPSTIAFAEGEENNSTEQTNSVVEETNSEPTATPVAPPAEDSDANPTATPAPEATEVPNVEATVEPTAEPHEHAWGEGEVTTAATCTEAGVKTYTCECGDSYTEPIDALGHSWNEGEVTTAATCTEAGEMTFTCACGETKTEEIPVLEHVYVHGVCECGGYDKEAVLEIGSFAAFKNAVEGNENKTLVLTDSIPNAEEIEEQKKDSSIVFECSLAENQKLYVFANGQDVKVNDLIVVPEGFELKSEGVGNKVVRYFLEKKAAEPEQEPEKEPVGEHEHEAEKWDVTLEPTCVEAGVAVFVCELCGEEVTVELSATGDHTLDEGEVTKEATTEEEGEIVYTCKVCGETFVGAIPVLKATKGGMRSTGPVAQVGSQTYDNIDEAITNWAKNTTLTLLANVTLTGVIKLNSNEKHTLNLGTYTMTAASGQNAIEIVCKDQASETDCLVINADATNPGGITATGKSCIYYNKTTSTKDRPIIRINGGVYSGSYTINITTKNSGTSVGTVYFNGGTFYAAIKIEKGKVIFNGGYFDGTVNCKGDQSAYRQVTGGTFKSWSRLQDYFTSGPADNGLQKFFVASDAGSAAGRENYNVGVYVNDNGYLVVGGSVITEAGDRFEASIDCSKWSSYLQYSSANTYGLYYTSASKAFEKINGSGTIKLFTSSNTDVNNVSSSLTVDATASGASYSGNVTLKSTSAKFIIKFNKDVGYYGQVNTTVSGGHIHIAESTSGDVVTRTYTVVKTVTQANAQAQVGSTYYETVYDAFYAVDGTSGKTITLLKDVYNASIITNGTAVGDGKTSVTFDLNGHRFGLQACGTGNDADYTLIVVDNSADKTGEVTNTTWSLIKLALTGIYDYSGKYTVIIQGGTWHLDPSNVSYGGQTYNLVPEGYAVTDNGNKTWTVGEAKPSSVAQTGEAGNETGYATVEEAIVAVDNPDTTITITGETTLGDITLNQGDTLNVTASAAPSDSNASATEVTITKPAAQEGGSPTVQTAYVVSNGTDIAVLTNQLITKDDSVTDGIAAHDAAADYVNVPAVLAGVVASENITPGNITSMEISLAKDEATVNDIPAAIEEAVGAADMAFEVHPVATVTAGGSSYSYDISNGELKNGASFTFTLALGSDYAGHPVSLTHYEGNTIATTLEPAPGTHWQADSNGNVDGVTLTSFSIVTVIDLAVASLSDGNTTTYYDNLADAIAAAQDGDTVTLLKDAAGNGIKVPQGTFNTAGLTVDFGNHTYTVDGTLVGSTGTETQAFQLLKDNTITFQNGTIYSAKAKMLIQNYSNLTLDGMTLTLENPNYAYAYTLSNNNGNVVIDDTTINANTAGGFAFDVCRYASYPSVYVTVTGTSQINGNVEVDAGSGDAKDGFGLTLESGTMTGNISLTNGAKAAIAATPEKAEVTKDEDFTQAAPAGYLWSEADTNGDQSLELGAATVTIAGVTTTYATLAGAFAAADGKIATIEVLKDCAGEGIIVHSGSTLTVNFNGHTYSITGTPVGSTGTETIGFQLLKDSTIVFNNGTISGSSRTNNDLMRLIQNYSNLTLNGMTLNLEGRYYNQITMSNCNGATVINNSTVNAPDYTWANISDSSTVGGAAFTVGTFSTYPSASVNVTGNSTINGDVKVDPSTNANANTLTLTGGTLNGDILMEDNAAEATVTKASTFTATAPEGYYWAEGTTLTPAVVMIGTTPYDTLEAAFAAAVDGDTITLYSDCSGNGIQVLPGRFTTDGLTVDFNGHTYTMDGTLVGSTGTQTQAFQLQRNNKITLKNGTITSTKAKMLINNYCDLTLDNMTLTLDNPNYASAYTLSNNNGNVVINDTTINANPAGGFAFDVCRGGGGANTYLSVHVTVSGDSVINGNVEIDAKNGDAKDGFGLTLESGTMTGNISLTNGAKAAIAATPEKAEVTKDEDFTQAAPAGYVWVAGETEGVQTLATAVASITMGDPAVTTYYASLADAIAAVPTDGTATTITMIADEAIAVSGYALTIPANKNVVLDLNGHQVVGQCSAAGTSALIRNLGTLTINDSSDPSKGKLIGGADPTWTWDGTDNYAGSYASNLIRNEGTLIINGGTLSNVSSGSAAYAIDNYSAGKVTVNGGTIDAANASAVRLFYNNGGSITVNDGNIGHYNSDEDCSFMGIQVMSGSKADVTISGGTIDGEYSVYSNGTGTSSVKISGGTFPRSVEFGSAGPDTISISGGEFGEWVGTWGSQTGFISGGVFAVEPDAETIIQGKAATVRDEDDNYVIGEAVAEIGAVGYISLSAAITAAQSGDTVTLLADINLTATQVIAKSLTIDLNGHDITATNARALWVKSGDMSIVDTNTIEDETTNTVKKGTISTAVTAGTALSSASSVIRVGDGAANNAKAKLTIGAGVTVSSGYCYGITVFGLNDTDSDKATSDIELVVDGTVAVTGSQAAISGNGTNTLSATTMTINGTVTAADDYAIYHPGKGTLTVAGTVSGKGGIEVKSGKVNITGGSVTATAGAQTHSANNNGTSTSGYAIAAISNGAYAGDPTVTISGGTIGGKAIILADGAAENTGVVTATSSSIPTDAGYAWKELAAGNYQLVEAVASITKGDPAVTTNYATLEAAFAAAVDGDTVVLLQNVALTNRLFVNAGATPAYAGTNNRYATTSENKSVTLDLNGHNITSTSNIALAGGSLAITGSGTISTSASGLAPIEIRGTGDLATKRALTIGEDVTLSGVCYGLNIFGSNNNTKNVIDVTVNGTVNGMLFVLGNLKNTTNEINIVVNGTVDASGAAGEEAVHTGIALAGYANVTVNNGAVVKGESGIEVRAGSLTVNGGAITATANAYSYAANGSGMTTKGAAIAVAQHSTKLATSATLNGGSLVGRELIAVVDVNSNDLTGVTVEATEDFVKGETEIPLGYGWSVKAGETPIYELVQTGVVVTFNANGGTGDAMAAQVITKNTATALSANTYSRTGYVFIGWNTAANGSGDAYADEAEVTLEADLELFAQWATCRVKSMISLNHNIAYTIGVYDFAGTGAASDYSNWTVKVDFNGKENYYPVPDSEDQYHRLTVAYVDSRQMADDITITLIYGHTDSDEGVVIGSYTTSIRAFCEGLIEKIDTSETQRNLCEATLTYGAYAQMHFNYNTGDLANKNLERIDADYQDKVPDTTISTDEYKFSYTGTVPSELGSLRTALSLDYEVTLSFGVKPSGGVTFIYDNEEMETTTVNNWSVAKIPEIRSIDLDKDYAVTIRGNNSTDEIIVHYSPFAFAAKNQNADNYMGELCRALYLYGLAADAYFD